MATHGLELGSLDLASPVAHEDGYTLSVLGDGASFGASQAVVREIVSMLADGNLVSYDRAGNRVAEFDVLIEGPDAVALQAGEVALRGELYKPNTVTWTPPSDFAAPTVYEVVTSEMAPQFDDIEEMRGRRVFHVTLTCAPFARSAELVTVEALAPPPATPTSITIHDADMTTGWSAVIGPYPVTVTDQGSFVRAAVAGSGADPGSGTLEVTLSVSPVALTATPYVVIELQNAVGSLFFSLTLDGVINWYPTPVLARALAGGTTLYTFDTNGATLSEIGIYSFHNASHQIVLDVHDVSATDTIPQVTNRQLTRVLEVGGTERTPASIHVQSANGTDLLSTAIVHTAPEGGSGYSPPLRRWRTDGNTDTADASTFSGAREPIHPDAVVSMVPTSALPEGGYLLAAFLRCTTSETVPIYWNAGTVPPGGSRMGDVTARVSWTFDANVWQLVPLGVVSLPTVRTQAGEVQVDILRDATSSAVVEIDEAWLFRIDDDCALSVVNVAYPNLWLDSPDLSTLVPTVWVGDSNEARTHPGTGLVTMGNHVLHPDGTALFTASSNTDHPEASATLYRRWHSNAAE